MDINSPACPAGHGQQARTKCLMDSLTSYAPILQDCCDTCSQNNTSTTMNHKKCFECLLTLMDHPGPPGTCFGSHLTALPTAFHSSVPGTQNCSPIHQCRLPVCRVTFLPLDPWLHPRVSNTDCGDTAWPHHEHASPLPPWRTWTSWPSRCPEGPPCNQIQGVPHGPEGWKAPCWEAPLQPHHLHAARKEYF